jgi:hypothetical protein
MQTPALGRLIRRDPGQIRPTAGSNKRPTSNMSCGPTLAFLSQKRRRPRQQLALALLVIGAGAFASTP